MSVYLTQNSNVLISGATGLIGGEIYRQLSEFIVGGTVWPLIRPTDGRSPGDRLSERLARSGDVPIFGRNVQPIAGDIRSPAWGMDGAVASKVMRDVDIIIHNAADTSFVARRSTADTNIDGAKQLVRLAQRCVRKPLIVFMSTASNVGDVSGCCLSEDDGCRPDNHHFNDYTQSKAVGEQIVRDSGLPILVLRPTIVLSASLQDAEFARQILWCIPLLRIFKALPLSAEARLDIVDVGFVAEATLRLMKRQNRSADCYNLSAGPNQSRSLGSLIRTAEEYYGRRTPLQFVSPTNWTRADRLRHVHTNLQRRIFLSLKHYFPFLNMDVVYDDTRLRNELGSDCPPVRPVEEYGVHLLALVRTKAALREAAVP